MYKRLFRSNRNQRKLFIKYFSISFTALSLLVISGTIGIIRLGNNIRPPEVPRFSPPPIHANSILDPTWGEIISLTKISTEEDFFEIPDPRTPEGWERKPNFFTILVMGLDGGVNANVIMIGAFDNEAQQAYIISIPRDTRVDAQRNRRKIVSAYPVGMLNGGGHEGGVERMKQEVQTLIGFRPDYYVMVDFDAFIQIVDAFGGVEIDVPFHMRYDDPYQDLHIDIPAGLQMLDGKNALHFARFRRANRGFQQITDYQRIENQQIVINALLQELLTPRTLLQVPGMIRAYRDYVSTDLSVGEKIWFARQLPNFRDASALSTYTLPTAGTSGAPAWYEFPCEAGILELVNRTVNPFKQDITADMLRIISS